MGVNLEGREYVIEQLVDGVPLGNHFNCRSGKFTSTVERETRFRDAGEAESVIREFGLSEMAKVSRCVREFR